MSPGIIVGDRDGGLVLGQRCVAQISLIDGREQERRVGKQLLPILAREHRRGAGDRHDEVRARDDRRRWIGCSRRSPVQARRQTLSGPRRPGRRSRVARTRWSRSTRKLAVKWSSDHVAAVERLQHQDLSDGRLRFDRRRPEHQQTSQRHTWESAAQARLTQEAQYGTHQVFALCKDIHLPSNHEIVARCGPDAFVGGGFHSRAAHWQGWWGPSSTRPVPRCQAFA